MMAKIVLSVSLPALAFNSFTAPIDDQTLKHGLAVLIFGILIFIILIFASKLFYLGYDHDRQTVLNVLTTFGSTTFFGIPIAAAIYGSKGTMYAYIFNIGYRIFLYSYAYIVMSGLKMKKKYPTNVFKPGSPSYLPGTDFILWIIQPYMPTLTGLNPETHKAVTVAFYRIDVTAPWLFKPLTYLASLSSPLAWLAIGSTLGEISFKSAVKNKTSLYYNGTRLLKLLLYRQLI